MFDYLLWNLSSQEKELEEEDEAMLRSVVFQVGKAAPL